MPITIFVKMELISQTRAFFIDTNSNVITLKRIICSELGWNFNRITLKHNLNIMKNAQLIAHYNIPNNGLISCSLKKPKRSLLAQLTEEDKRASVAQQQQKQKRQQQQKQQQTRNRLEEYQLQKAIKASMGQEMDHEYKPEQEKEHYRHSHSRGRGRERDGEDMHDAAYDPTKTRRQWISNSLLSHIRRLWPTPSRNFLLI